MSNGVLRRRFSRRRFLKLGSAAAVVAVVAGVGGYFALQQPAVPQPPPATPAPTPAPPLFPPPAAERGTVRSVPIEVNNVPTGSYVFIELKKELTSEVIEGRENVTLGYIDFPTYWFDAASGELSPQYVPQGFWRELEVNDSLVAVLGHGTYALGNTVTGTSTAVHGIYSSTRMEETAGLVITRIAEDGNITLRYNPWHEHIRGMCRFAPGTFTVSCKGTEDYRDEAIELEPGGVWKSQYIFVGENKSEDGLSKARFKIAVSIENFGWQLKAKILE